MTRSIRLRLSALLVFLVVLGISSAGCLGSSPKGELGVILWQDEGGYLGIDAGEKVAIWIGGDIRDPSSAPTKEIEWDLGDGTERRGNPVWHTYAASGRYHVVATYQGEMSDMTMRVSSADS